MSLDMNLVPLFLAVAEERNFRAAADRRTDPFGSQPSDPEVGRCAWRCAVHADDSLGAIDGSGEDLRDALTQPWSDIQQALEFSSSEDAPKGRLRVAVTSIAERFLAGPLLASFAAAPISPSMSPSRRRVRYRCWRLRCRGPAGEVIELDMVAVPLTEQREVAVASPGYLATHGRPSSKGLGQLPMSWLYFADGRTTNGSSVKATCRSA